MNNYDLLPTYSFTNCMSYNGSSNLPSSKEVKLKTVGYCFKKKSKIQRE